MPGTYPFKSSEVFQVVIHTVAQAREMQECPNDQAANHSHDDIILKYLVTECKYLVQRCEYQWTEQVGWQVVMEIESSTHKKERKIVQQIAQQEESTFLVEERFLLLWQKLSASTMRVQIEQE